MYLLQIPSSLIVFDFVFLFSQSLFVCYCCTGGKLHGGNQDEHNLVCYNDVFIVGPIFVSSKEYRSLIDCIT